MMREVVVIDTQKCMGCNRCIRVCPVSEANIAYIENGETKVIIDSKKCIACGACIQNCKHEARSYIDDTEKFFRDLHSGVPISVFIAPAARSNFHYLKKLITWLKAKGVTSVYDVSLGADICTWAHIRYIQQNSPDSVITQPCPAIVNYITKHRTELLPYLSPIHSPMLCTAVYMKKYKHIDEKIAAISPCIAKAHEFEDTGIVHYNVTFDKLLDYLLKHGIEFTDEETEFDNMEAGLGRIYSLPGGLKENVEYYLGKALRVDKSEGQGIVYKALDAFAKEAKQNLPAVFDVLNCPEGCNLGTACRHQHSMFAVNKAMDDQRRYSMDVLPAKEAEERFAGYDKALNLKDFIRNYVNKHVSSIPYSEEDVERVFNDLGKHSDNERQFNCYACGSETCHEMAVKIAKSINVPDNCMQKSKNDALIQHQALVEEQQKGIAYLMQMMNEIMEIKQNSDAILLNIESIDQAMQSFGTMAKTINKISFETRLIALNAAIEAARSGKQGLAFAVVASEIKSLSESTRKSIEENSKQFEEALTTLDGMKKMIVNSGQLVGTTYENVKKLCEK